MNDLQRLFKLRDITMQELADQIGFSMHPVQKTVKGVRTTKHIQLKIADFIGLTVDECFGPASRKPLRLLITQEIKKKRGEFEKKLKIKILGENTLSSAQRAVND